MMKSFFEIFPPKRIVKLFNIIHRLKEYNDNKDISFCNKSNSNYNLNLPYKQRIFYIFILNIIDKDIISHKILFIYDNEINRI